MTMCIHNSIRCNKSTNYGFYCLSSFLKKTHSLTNFCLIFLLY